MVSARGVSRDTGSDTTWRIKLSKQKTPGRDRLGTYTYFPSQHWVRDPVLIRISFRFSLARRSVSQATPRGAELVEVLEGGAQGLDQLRFESGLQDFPDGWLGKWLLLSVPWFPHLPF